MIWKPSSNAAGPGREPSHTDMPITGLTQYLILWATLGLAAYGAFCLSVTFRGITEDAPLELKVAWWCGRFILVVATIALWIVLSRGLIELSLWIMR